MLRAFVTPVVGILTDLYQWKTGNYKEQINEEKKPVNLKKKSVGYLNAFFWGCMGILFLQQLMRLYDVYAVKVSEYDRDLLLYSTECPYNGISAARLKECRDANITINSWPIARAVSQLVQEWPSCFIAPCGDIVSGGLYGFGYRVMIALILVCVMMYVFNFINCIKVKSKEGIDKYRLKETNKELIKLKEMINKQHNICSK